MVGYMGYELPICEIDLLGNLYVLMMAGAFSRG